METPRKIALPDYCSPHDVTTTGGDKSCDHDYPPETKDEHDTYVTWTCSRCGIKTRFGVYD